MLVAGHVRRFGGAHLSRIDECEQRRQNHQVADHRERHADAEHDAEAGDATVGGKRQGAMLEATLLENVPVDQELCAGEAFGPVAVLSSFTDFDQVLAEVDDSAYGLQAGIFTSDINRAFKAWEKLDVGGVVIGDIPSWRVDSMPYGGVKDSGFGREGIKFAMEEMSEIKLMIIRSRET